MAQVKELPQSGISAGIIIAVLLGWFEGSLLLSILIVAAIFGYALYATFQISRQLARTGYHAPVQWRGVPSKSPPIKIKVPQAGERAEDDENWKREQREGIKIIDKAALLERSAMPSFTLWFFGPDYFGHEQKNEWLSVLDGNRALAQPGSGLHFIQLTNHREQKACASRGHMKLKLYEISAKDALALNTGPRRTERVHVVSYPQGRSYQLPLQVGTLGGTFPQAAPQPDTTHGSAKLHGLNDSADATTTHGSARASGLNDMADPG